MNKEEETIIDILILRMKIKIQAKEEEIEIAEVKLEGYRECIKDMKQILESLKVLEGEEDEGN